LISDLLPHTPFLKKMIDLRQLRLRSRLRSSSRQVCPSRPDCLNFSSVCEAFYAIVTVTFRSAASRAVGMDHSLHGRGIPTRSRNTQVRSSRSLPAVEFPSFRGHGHRYRRLAAHLCCSGHSGGCKIVSGSPLLALVAAPPERENAIGQTLGVVAHPIEASRRRLRLSGEGRPDRFAAGNPSPGSGKLTPASAAGFGAFETALPSGLFRTASR